MEIKIGGKKEFKPTVGDIVVSRKGAVYVLSYEPHADTFSKYIARTLDGLGSSANGYYQSVGALWDSLEAIGFTLYSQEEYELLLIKK